MFNTKLVQLLFVTFFSHTMKFGEKIEFFVGWSIFNERLGELRMEMNGDSMTLAQFKENYNFIKNTLIQVPAIAVGQTPPDSGLQKCY